MALDRNERAELTALRAHIAHQRQLAFSRAHNPANTPETRAEAMFWHRDTNGILNRMDRFIALTT